MLQRLLLLPLLSPLLAALLIAAINPRPWVALRLLTWTSPAWPLGAWLAGATAAGAGLSAAGTGLALLGRPNPTPARRQVRRSGEATDGGEPAPWRRPAATPAPGPAANGSAWAGPSRQAGDPPPTVSVPFRVIRRGSGGAGPTATTAAPTASATSTGTASASGADDWNQSDSDDW